MSEVKEAVGLAGDGRHCVEFWLDGHNPERTEWVEGPSEQTKNFESSGCPVGLQIAMACLRLTRRCARSQLEVVEPRGPCVAGEASH